MKKKEFLSGVASLSFSMLVIQSTSMGFSVYISSLLGAEQMGLFHLIMSVYAFAVTIAVSGIPLSVTRLVSESVSPKSVIKTSLKISLVISVMCTALLFLLSDWLSLHVLKNPSVSVAIKMLSVSLPFIAISGVARGYFIGVQKISAITTGRMADEFSSIFIMLFMLRHPLTKKWGVFIPVTATVLSSVIGCAVDFILCVKCIHKKPYASSKCSVSSVLSISLPVATGSCIRSALGSTENLLIPRSLSAFGTANALQKYGTVKAMAMPTLMFPYVFLQSLTSLLVPEISSRNAHKKGKSVIRAAKKSLVCTLMFATVVAIILLLFGRRLGLALYSNLEAGYYITALALLAIPMYIDSVTDSLLKGLNQQVYSLKINIVDSALRVCAIYFVLPQTGIYGYIGILYISEVLNLSMSMHRLKKIL